MSYNSDDVRQHKDESSAWITHKGRVFDITEFLSRHPGGKQVLLPKLGSDVTEFMRDPQIHKHTKLAYNMLSKYYIGKLRIEVSTVHRCLYFRTNFLTWNESLLSVS